MEKDKNTKGCGKMAEFGGHEYATWSCPQCGQEICWNCSVRCTDDGSGDGEITCPHCGQTGYYENGNPVY
jgi:predicted RNA-binding Zn-ribbon protein involved in translation (DUF1610 family)